MLLLEDVLVLGAQRHDRAHVDLVEGGQHGGGVLGFLQAARDGLAQLGHAHPLLARLVGAGDGARGPARRGAALRRRGRRRRGVATAASTSPLVTWPPCRCRRPAAGSSLFSADDALAAAGAGGIGGGLAGGAAQPADAAVRRSLAGRGAWRRRGLAAGAAGRRRRAGRDLARAARRRRPSRRPRRRSRPARRRPATATSRVTLSVSSSTSGSSAFDGVAGLLDPLADGGFGDGFAKGRNADVSRHGRALVRSVRLAGSWTSARSAVGRGSACEVLFQVLCELIRPVAGRRRRPGGRRSGRASP